MSNDEQIRMYIANCQICTLASYMKTCLACKYNIGLSDAGNQMAYAKGVNMNCRLCGHPTEDHIDGAKSIEGVERCVEKGCKCHLTQKDAAAHFDTQPQKLSDANSTIEIVNDMARNGILVDTEKHKDYWIAKQRDGKV